ncbi:YceD family protein [Rothia mucilaginosa]|uniref:YceD family protein n=1 Tax=Rothia mucilaginosa TaxID=43675 RepID=UPI00121AEB16|nr:MAG: DUF177 domain-containing protein [Rothia mucilaginosa]
MRMTPKMGLWFIHFVRRNAISRADALPLVVSVTNLIHRPGTMETLTEVLPAPADLGNTLIGVEEGSDIDLDIRMESVVDGILVTGSVVVDVHGECSLCLDPIDYEMSANIQELFVFEKAPAGGPEDEVDEQYAVEDDSIDLEPALRDAVILQLPFQPVCRDTCQGLCADCGARLEDDPGHHHEVLDPRWSALQGLLGADTEN